MSDDPSGGGGEDCAEALRPEVIPANPSLLCWEPDLRAEISWGHGAHPRFDPSVLAALSLAESYAVRPIHAGAVDVSRLETLSEEVLDNEQGEEALEEEGVFISTFTYL